MAKASVDADTRIRAFAADDPELSAALDNYQAAHDSMAELLCREQFAEGFALAVRMIFESL